MKLNCFKMADVFNLCTSEFNMMSIVQRHDQTGQIHTALSMTKANN
jgi:hypothetical protein